MPTCIRKYTSLTVLLLTIFGVGQAYAASGIQRSVEDYQPPDVVLVDQNGDEMSFKDLANQDRPVLLDFIYTTCTTICPVLSAGYSHLQRKLGDHSETVQLISVSIDPEYDRPQLMKEYLERYQSRKGWTYLTGSRQDVDTVMHSFDAYVSNKMSHYPVTLIKAPGKDQWVRLYGLVGTKRLISEIEQLYGPLQIESKP